MGSTQPLTGMSTRNISWGKGGRCVGLTTLPTSCARLSRNLGASTSWNPKGLSRPVMGLLFIFLKVPVLNLSHMCYISRSNNIRWFVHQD
jgi:hypothetical protein